MRRHPKYKIKENDTISSITQLFDVEEAIWLRYHNNACPLGQIIQDNKIPKYLTEIFLLPELWEKESELNRKISNVENIQNSKVGFGIDNSIYIKKTPIKRVYRSKIEYPQSRTRVDYEIYTEGLQRLPQAIVVKFHKKNFFINTLQPDMIMDEVAVKSAEGIYPIFLSIDYLKGVKEILNRKEILEAWQTTQKSIKKEYTGQVIDNYLMRTEDVLQSDKITYELINNDIFFALFTHSIYGAYTDSLRYNSQMRLSTGSYNSALNFKGEQWIEPLYNNVGGVFVYFKGYAEGIDNITKMNTLFELNIEYNLEFENFSIKDIIAEIAKLDANRREILMKANIHQLREYETNN